MWLFFTSSAGRNFSHYMGSTPFGFSFRKLKKMLKSSSNPKRKPPRLPPRSNIKKPPRGDLLLLLPELDELRTINWNQVDKELKLILQSVYNKSFGNMLSFPC